MKKIIQDRGIQRGRATIEGTRVTVKSILLSLRDGLSASELSRRYEENGLKITVSDIFQALTYASKQPGIINGN